MTKDLDVTAAAQEEAITQEKSRQEQVQRKHTSTPVPSEPIGSLIAPYPFFRAAGDSAARTRSLGTVRQVVLVSSDLKNGICQAWLID